MRTKAWGGLITNASPFALPAGAAVEQVNLSAHVPGQLSSRGGMRPVATVGQQPPLLDIYPFDLDGKTHLVGLTASGELVALESPAYGEELASPVEPQLSVSAGQVAVSYTHRILDGESDGPSTDPAPPSPPVSQYISSLDGGRSSTQQWPLYVDASQQCDGAGKESVFVGGTAATSKYPASLMASELCSKT